MLQDYTTIYQTALTILSAIITGGFVLIYVELSNKKQREEDKYEQLMRPFMHKLSSYLRFVSWSKNKIRYPREGQLGGEQEFKKIVNQLATWGGQAITSGGDYRVNSFNGKQLYDISFHKINHIWYLTHHEHRCNLEWDANHDFTDEFIRKELIEINPNYKELPLTLDSFIKVSAEFHTEIYQMIESDIDIHEARTWLLKRHTRFVSLSLFLVLLLLCMLVLFQIPGWCIQTSTLLVLLLLTVCLLMLGIDHSTQIRWYNIILERNKSIFKSMKSIITHRLLEPFGLLLILSAFCWQTISNEYKSQQEQRYQSTIDKIIITTADQVAASAYRDTTNYKGKAITNFNPESITKATSTVYLEQQELSDLYYKYRRYYWIQVILYIVGSAMIVIGKTIHAIRNGKQE